MYKSILTVVLGYSVSATALADMGMSTALQLGYRVDNLDWNIAGDINGQNPNVLSELQWTGLQIPQAKLDINAYMANFYLKSNFSYGEIKGGDNQDSDYYSDNRTNEFSRSNNGVGGEVADASIGLGYKIDTSRRDDKLRSYFMPMLGYSINIQNLQMNDGVQTVASNLSPPLGPFPGLNSSYDAQWQGGWVGLLIGEENTKTDLTIELSMIYHNVNYQAEADWNLRSDFAHPKSFEQRADGNGVTLSLSGRSPLGHSKKWFWAFGLDYGRWQTNAGLDYTYFADGSTALTRLNKVRWESSAINLGLELRL